MVSGPSYWLYYALYTPSFIHPCFRSQYEGARVCQKGSCLFVNLIFVISHEDHSWCYRWTKFAPARSHNSTGYFGHDKRQLSSQQCLGIYDSQCTSDPYLLTRSSLWAHGLLESFRSSKTGHGWKGFPILTPRTFTTESSGKTKTAENSWFQKTPLHLRRQTSRSRKTCRKMFRKNDLMKQSKTHAQIQTYGKEVDMQKQKGS